LEPGSGSRWSALAVEHQVTAHPQDDVIARERHLPIG